MLPSDHVIVTANIASVYYNHMRNEFPGTRVAFSWTGGGESTPEELLERIPSFPKNVRFHGNPLYQSLDFLRLTLVELTNRGHIVTVAGLGDRRIPWKLIMPGVRYELLHDENFRSDNYRKLTEHDMVKFLYTNLGEWETILKDLQYARTEWNPKCKFRIVTLNTMLDKLRQQVFDNQLEVEIGQTI